MPRSSLAGVAALALACSALAGCTSDLSAEPSHEASPAAQSESPTVPPVRVRTNVGKRDVAVDETLRVHARHGALQKVRVTSEEGPLPGKLAGDETSWRATGRLEPGVGYSVRSVAEDEAGERVVRTTSFRTDDLTLDEQTYAAVAPLDGETVGVGMPVIVTFDIPVSDRASMEKHMSVKSTPKQAGTWHWISDNEVHWRPRKYWQPGSDVSVDVDVNSVDAGNGIYGQESRHVDFAVGDAHVYKVNAQTHQMQVFSNGNLLRTIPITTGKAGFVTRSGTKVIIEKFESKRMNSETIGINPDSAEGYDLDDVKYAMRVTYTGEFLHAAPWSVASQGSANVSHGCTGMSTDNAAWLYDLSRRGDVVQYTGTNRPMTLTNGYGDWNESYATYREGSALS